MENMSAKIEKEQVFQNLPTSLARKYGFYSYEEIDSTNTEAKRLIASGADLPFAVTANYQTAGRGRLGRSFFSPSCDGLYLSIAIDPRNGGYDLNTITAFAATAVAKALDNLKCGLDIGIKWVNDLYVCSKKICGILCEAGSTGKTEGIDYVIIGVGVNLSRTDFPDDIKDIAGSIVSLGGKKLEREPLIAEIIKEVDNYRADFINDYRKRSVILGKNVTVMDPDCPYVAKALEITETGSLLVETKDKKINEILFGEISIRLDK